MNPTDPGDAERLTLRVETQQSEVADEVSAVTAVTRPILEGLFYSLNRSIVEQAGGRANITLALMSRLYVPGDGDVGVCFEYAVHDAMNRGDARVLDRVTTALHRCRVPGTEVSSILFGAEKSGALNLIETTNDRLTDDSRVLTGEQSQPPKLKNYINLLVAALRRPEVRTGLPYSISGLWKADLFLGHTDRDRWVGTTVKVNQRHLEGARGLRIGIVPAAQGRSDAITKDDAKNLIICPLPYDGSFMETFYEAWQVVKTVIAANAEMPREDILPQPALRQVARYLVQRANTPMHAILEALDILAQPNLLDTTTYHARATAQRPEPKQVGTVIAPRARII